MPERAPERLQRKLRWVFITQAFIASLVMALGLIYGGAYLRDRMLQDRLESEAAQVWAAIDHDGDAHLSRNLGIVSWMLPANGAEDGDLPAELRGYGPGLHRIANGRRWVYVSEHDGRRLVLSLQPRTAKRIALYNTLLAR